MDMGRYRDYTKEVKNKRRANDVFRRLLREHYLDTREFGLIRRRNPGKDDPEEKVDSKMKDLQGFIRISKLFGRI